MAKNKNAQPLATMTDSVPSSIAHTSSVEIQVQRPPATTPSDAAVPLPTRMALSAIAGVGAATVCHPLDVVRVQMQVLEYRSSLDAANAVYREAGVVGLYNGISAAYLRQFLYGSCRMGIYSFLVDQLKAKNVAAGRGQDEISLPQKMGMGCISGAIGSFVGTPSEVALVRMSADSKLPADQRRKYSSVGNCLTRMAREEGVTSLWTGAVPTVARATLLSACLMGITSEAKTKLSKTGYFGPDGQMLGGYPMLFTATLMSSFAANLVSNPFDVMKSRMQNMPVVDGKPLYTGVVDCFKKSIRSEGIFVLWKGFTPAFVKLAPYSIISLTLLDKLTKAVTGKDAL